MAVTVHNKLYEQDNTFEKTTQHFIEVTTNDTDYELSAAIQNKKQYVVGLQYYFDGAHTVTIKSGADKIYEMSFPNGGGISIRPGDGVIAYGKKSENINISVDVSVCMTIHTTESARYALKR